MKTYKLHRCVAFLMAILLFCTSVGAAVDMHFCGGELKSFSLFGEAKSCQELAEVEQGCETSALQADSHTGCSFDRKGCCEDRFAYLSADQDFPNQITVAESDVSPIVFSAIPVANPTINYQNLNVPSTFYQPPNLSKNYLVLLQIFLL